jgi:2-polyprenyl-6-hydroxyphenyl methylase/3-demethylubiquinone-9 3-methyltransferase
MKPDRPMIEQLMDAAAAGSPTPPIGPRNIHAHVTRPIVQQLVAAEAHHVLDLGCGNGWFTDALSRCGFDVVGADVSPVDLRAARKHYPERRYHEVDVVRELDPSLCGRFDAVVAVHLIDHVPYPRRLLDTAMAALKPGGLLIVTSNFHGYSKNLALALAGRFDSRWDPLLDEGRMKFFSRSTLTSLLTEFDLQALHFQTVGRIPMFARAMLMSGRKPG